MLCYDDASLTVMCIGKVIGCRLVDREVIGLRSVFR